MKISILGAGGVRTPLLIRSIARHQDRLGIGDLSLMDIDAARLDLMSYLTQDIEESGSLSFSIRRTTDAAQALDGADFVITTFRVGGMPARVVDERVPLSYGVLGQETTGPGGFAMAMRTIPVFFDYLELMSRVCPDAWLVNFANPSGLLAEAALRVFGWQRTVGICDAPSQMLTVAAAYFGIPHQELYLDYFGLNHLGWVRAMFRNQADILPAAIDRICEMGGIPEMPFSAGLLSHLRMVPNEYLYYYYNTRETVENILRSEQTRGEQILAENEALFADLDHLRVEGAVQPALNERYDRYLDHRGSTYMRTEAGPAFPEQGMAPLEDVGDFGEGYAGVALSLIEALSGAGARVIILNTLNRGAIAGMLADDVVEVPAHVGKGMVHPMAVGEVPADCLALLRRVKVYERLTIEAAVEHSYPKALQALATHPLVPDEATARKILDGYIQEHAGSFPSLT